MLSPDYKEFIELLNKNQIEYLIVGGYAVGIYGFPHYTGDIDIWIKISNENAGKMVSILDEFGFGSYQLKKEDFLNVNNVIQLGYPPLRIDIIMSIDGVAFDESYRKKTIKIIDEMPINFIGFDELIKNKKATGRDKDLFDINNLT